MEAKPQLVHFWWSPMGPWGAKPPKNRATPLDFHCNRRLQWPHLPTTTFSPNVLLLVWLLNQHKLCFSNFSAATLVWSFQKSSFKQPGTLHLSFIFLKLYLKPAQKKPLLGGTGRTFQHLQSLSLPLLQSLCENDRINYSLGVTG